MSSGRLIEPIIPAWMVGVLVLVIPLIAIGGGAYGCSVASCSDTAEQANVPTKHSIWSGCYVQIDGHWVPADRWRSIEEP